MSKRRAQPHYYLLDTRPFLHHCEDANHRGPIVQNSYPVVAGVVDVQVHCMVFIIQQYKAIKV
jgi:hypothetical protein